ncbi:MAG TPA: hypothetical protein EYP14_18855 [Planctomycetaceae bacterium]|nr:hypothetical protein [Planctomycetaceae bacterium]
MKRLFRTNRCVSVGRCVTDGSPVCAPRQTPSRLAIRLGILRPRVGAKASVLALAVVVALSSRLPAGRAEAAGGQVEFFVSLNGDDHWSGRLAEPNADRSDGPFRTLSRARDAVRQWKKGHPFPKGGVIVYIRGGLYELTAPLELSEQDSGQKGAPVTYQAYRNEQVRLVGGRRVTDFRPVTDPKVLNQLDPAARANVVVADLRAIGVDQYGSPAGGGLELFYNSRPMTLARWPNEGFVRIADIAAPLDRTVHGRKGSRIGKFVYESNRPRRWLAEPDLWLHGYWFWDWSDQRQKVKSIDIEHKTIELEPPYHHYGYRKGQWYYAFNALCEIDLPSEWYLDRQAGRLYFWPPQPVATSEAIVSVLPSLLVLKDVSHVTLRRLGLEAARGTAITISGGQSVRIEGCTLRNEGGWAVTVRNGRDHVVQSCDIYGLGGGGISLSGGDRRTLTPANLKACNNHIHHYGRWDRMYRPAIALSGVGNRACHNLIHDAPHQAFSFSGNDHVIELNEIHHVCLESNDAGAIYSGRDWTMRGTVIRHNYLHHITGFRNRGCMGVYLDDMLCGTRIEGNVFHKVARAAFIGGGRDNAIVNNIFVDCRPAVHVDARALGWASYHVKTTMMQRLNAMPYRKPPWSNRYPRLVTILEENPAAPEGNLIARNICVGGRWDEIQSVARPLITFRDNLIDVDPQFVDPDRQDFRLKATSPAFQIGFEPIPMGEIGLFRDELRPSRRQ